MPDFLIEWLKALIVIVLVVFGMYILKQIFFVGAGPTGPLMWIGMVVIAWGLYIFEQFLKG